MGCALFGPNHYFCQKRVTQEKNRYQQERPERPQAREGCALHAELAASVQRVPGAHSASELMPKLGAQILPPPTRGGPTD